MGIVRKQGIISALVIYAGFGFGALNLLVLFPKFFTPEEIGLTRVLFAFGNIMLQLSLIGMVPTLTKFNPFYRDYLPKQDNDLYSRAFLISGIGFSIVSVLSWIFKSRVCDYFIARSPLLVTYYNLIYPFTFFLLIFTLLGTISQVNLKTVLSNILSEVGVRVTTSVILILTIIGWIDFDGFIKLFSFLLYGIPSVILFVSLKKSGDLNFTTIKSRVTARLSQKMNIYSLYLFSGVIIFVLAQQADTLLIAGLVGLGSTSVYMIADYIVTLIQVPARSLTGIVTPLFSIAWKEKNHEQIKLLYQKTALNQLIPGLFIFGLIWANIDFLFNFLGEDYKAGKPIIAVLACSKLLDLAFGPNNEFLSTSNRWAFNFYSMVVLLALFIPANFFLIKTFGPIGAAYSTVMSFFLFNSIRCIYIYRKFKMQPFTIAYLKVITPFIVAIGGCSMPLISDHLFMQSVVKTFVFITLFLGALLLFKPSEDLSLLFQQLCQYRKKFK